MLKHFQLLKTLFGADARNLARAQARRARGRHAKLTMASLSILVLDAYSVFVDSIQGKCISLTASVSLHLKCIYAQRTNVFHEAIGDGRANCSRLSLPSAGGRAQDRQRGKLLREDAFDHDQRKDACRARGPHEWTAVGVGFC